MFGFKTPASFSSDWGATWTHAATEFPAISSVQRAVLMRLREGPLLLCLFTDQRAAWKERNAPSIDRSTFVLSGTMAESGGYLAATQTRDGRVHLISSKNHYVFNLAWLEQLPPAPKE